MKSAQAQLSGMRRRLQDGGTCTLALRSGTRVCMDGAGWQSHGSIYKFEGVINPARLIIFVLLRCLVNLYFFVCVRSMKVHECIMCLVFIYLYHTVIIRRIRRCVNLAKRFQVGVICKYYLGLLFAIIVTALFCRVTYASRIMKQPFSNLRA